jgi:hypothetical protein
MLRVFENRVLRKIFGPKRDDARGAEGDCTVTIFVICTPHKMLCG